MLVILGEIKKKKYFYSKCIEISSDFYFIHFFKFYSFEIITNTLNVFFKPEYYSKIIYILFKL